MFFFKKVRWKEQALILQFTPQMPTMNRTRCIECNHLDGAVSSSHGLHQQVAVVLEAVAQDLTQVCEPAMWVS